MQLLTRVLREAKPGFVLSSLSVNQNVRTLPHVDRNNLCTEPNVVLPLSRFQGGGIWVETTNVSVPLRHIGEVLPVNERAVAFDPRRLHATQSWTGSRVVLIGYTVRGCERLTEEQRARALNLGFVLPPLDPNAPAAPRASEIVSESLQPVKAPSPGASASASFAPSRIDPASFASCVKSSAQVVTSRSLALTPAVRVPNRVCLPGEPARYDRGLLLDMPPGRFVISSVFPDLNSALSSAPGWLDLFSGSRGFAKALAACSPCWILCLDISHGEDEDLLRRSLPESCSGTYEGQNVCWSQRGPLRSSFSSAITPAWRTKEYPQGHPWLRQDQRDKVLAGNKMLEFTLEVVQAASRCGAVFWIENPHGSWFWRQPARLGQLASRRPSGRMDSCLERECGALATTLTWLSEEGRDRPEFLGRSWPSLTRRGSRCFLRELLLRTLAGWEISGRSTSPVVQSAGRVGSERRDTPVREELTDVERRFSYGR